MKRALSLLLAAAITVSLCACGGGTAAQETTIATSAATTAAPTTEAATVATTVETTEPEPEYTYVDITMDNWQEYFTMSDVTPVFSKYGFAKFDVTLSLNEPYRDRVAQNGNVMSLLDGEITVGVSYKKSYYQVEVDEENQTAKKTGGRLSFLNNESGNETCHLNDASFRSYVDNGGDGFTACLIHGSPTTTKISGESEIYYFYPENIEITSISGTLPLLPE